MKTSIEDAMEEYQDNVSNLEHITGFKDKIRKAHLASEEDFFGFFNGNDTIEQSFIKGAWDFSTHIVDPIRQLISKPETMNALEIGHGGGRLVAAAARHFKHVSGVDIHSENSLVTKELMKKGIGNISLHMCDGLVLPQEECSIDVVYSFIVFQHLEKISTVKGYLAEIERVLSSGGVGVIYYGRYRHFSIGTRRKWLFWSDLVAERLLYPIGFHEFEADINSTNLYITRPYMRRLVEDSGLTFIKHLNSYRPDYVSYGGQHGIVFTKG